MRGTMNTQNLLEKLRKQRDGIDFTIQFLEHELTESEIKTKRKAIIKETKIYKKRNYQKYNKSNPHWTQKPENKARLRKAIRKAMKARYGK